MDCVTPSHPVAIPEGQSLDIYQLLNQYTAVLGPPSSRKKVRIWPYAPRQPVLAELQPNYEYLAAQITTSDRQSTQKKSRLKQ